MDERRVNFLVQSCVVVDQAGVFYKDLTTLIKRNTKADSTINLEF